MKKVPLDCERSHQRLDDHGRNRHHSDTNNNTDVGSSSQHHHDPSAGKHQTHESKHVDPTTKGMLTLPPGVDRCSNFDNLRTKQRSSSAIYPHVQQHDENHHCSVKSSITTRRVEDSFTDIPTSQNLACHKESKLYGNNPRRLELHPDPKNHSEDIIIARNDKVPDSATTTDDLSKRLKSPPPQAEYSATQHQQQDQQRPRKPYLQNEKQVEKDQEITKIVSPEDMSPATLSLHTAHHHQVTRFMTQNNNEWNEKYTDKSYFPQIMEADPEENQKEETNRNDPPNKEKYAGKKHFPEIMEADPEEETTLDNCLHPGAVAVRNPYYAPHNVTLAESSAGTPAPSPDVLDEQDLISAVLVSDENTGVLAPAVAIQEPKVSRKCLVISVLMLVVGLLVVTITVVMLVTGSGSNSNEDQSTNSTTPSDETTLPPTKTIVWTKLGQTLTGEPYGSITIAFGSSISISGDGNVLAVGNPFYVDETASTCGQVVIIKFVGNEWKPVGQVLQNASLTCWFGQGVSLSSDGTLLAVNDYNPWWENGDSFGEVQVFLIKDNVWVQHGRSQGNHDSLSLSSDGSLLAVRQIHYSNGDGEKSGEVKVFKLTSDPSNKWTQQGGALLGGVTNSSLFRHSSSLSLSGDGTVLVARGKVWDVQAYRWLGDNNQWIHHGQLLQGETDYGEYGFSLSLSNEGTVLAVGAPLDEEVTVLELINDRWEQKGQILQGKTAFDWFGWSVSLSSNGNIIAVGAIGADEFTGLVEVDEFTNSEWQQQGQILHGEATNSWFGGSISLSNNGTILAIGGDGGGLIDGQVKVYQLGYVD